MTTSLDLNGRSQASRRLLRLATAMLFGMAFLVLALGLAARTRPADAHPVSGLAADRGSSLATGPRTALPALWVGAGYEHSCARINNGDLKCWGQNDLGQLGLGDVNFRGNFTGEMGGALTRVTLGPGRTASYATGGQYHTCALLDNGDVKCWGYNIAYGVLGLEDATTRGDGPNEMGGALPKVNLGAGRAASGLASGSFFNCVVLENGDVKCWGANTSGQLGLGDTDDRGDDPGEMGGALPEVNLGAGLTAVEVAAGAYYSCARLNDGSVKCWGKNDAGQLGLGDTADRGDGPGEMGANLTTVNLGPGRTAIAIATGFAHTCAVLDDGTVKCWGANNAGQLGLSDTLDRGDDGGEMGGNLPTVNLGPGRTAVALALGSSYTCAILDNGNVKCWGYNFHGQLGQSDQANRGDEPNEMGNNLPSVNFGPGRTATGIAAGLSHTCALLDDGSVKCWGRNASGQLGQEDVESRGDGAGEMGANLLPVALGGVPSPCPGPADFVVSQGVTGEVYCGAAYALTGAGAILPPALVSAIFLWNNGAGARRFDFWFRGFPDSFQTLTSVSPGNQYFVQASGSAQFPNSGGGTTLADSGTTEIPAVTAGINGAVWAGGPHWMSALGSYPSIAAVTAIFCWNNVTQGFNFWFRGFPDGFQTLVNGIERGKYYFFQTPAGQTIPMD
jgi:alpha-tubulin suppressor-like RCC1 family protein